MQVIKSIFVHLIPRMLEVSTPVSLRPLNSIEPEGKVQEVFEQPRVTLNILKTQLSEIFFFYSSFILLNTCRTAAESEKPLNRFRICRVI